MSISLLHPTEFEMPIKDILKLRSADAETERLPGKKGKRGTQVKHALPRKRREIEQQPDYYNAVKESMAKEQTVPITLSQYGGRTYLNNGHHRIILAQQLGKKTMRVRTAADQDEGEDWAFNKQHPAPRFNDERAPSWIDLGNYG